MPTTIHRSPHRLASGPYGLCSSRACQLAYHMQGSRQGLARRFYDPFSMVPVRVMPSLAEFNGFNPISKNSSLACFSTSYPSLLPIWAHLPLKQRRRQQALLPVGSTPSAFLHTPPQPAHLPHPNHQLRNRQHQGRLYIPHRKPVTARTKVPFPDPPLRCSR